MEILQGHLTWLETTKEPPTNAPIRDFERVKLEYELIEFGNKAVEELIRESRELKAFAYSFVEKFLQLTTAAKHLPRRG